MQIMPFGHMGKSMHGCKLRSDHYCFERCTLAILVTTALKMPSGLRYVELMESNQPIVVFACLIAITVDSAGAEMDLT